MLVNSPKISVKLDNKSAVWSTNLHQQLKASGKLSTKTHTTNIVDQSTKVSTWAKTCGVKLDKLELPSKPEILVLLPNKVNKQQLPVECTSHNSHSTNNNNSNNWDSLMMWRKASDKLQTPEEMLSTKLVTSLTKSEMAGKKLTHNHTTSMDNKSLTWPTKDSNSLMMSSDNFNNSEDSNNSNNWASLRV